MGQYPGKLNMYAPAVFAIRIQGEIGEDWAECFGAQSIAVDKDEAGLSSTTLISEPVDQAALVGMINLLNGLGLPLVSVEHLPTDDTQPGGSDKANRRS